MSIIKNEKFLHHCDVTTVKFGEGDVYIGLEDSMDSVDLWIGEGGKSKPGSILPKNGKCMAEILNTPVILKFPTVNSVESVIDFLFKIKANLLKKGYPQCSEDLSTTMIKAGIQESCRENFIQWAESEYGIYIEQLGKWIQYGLDEWYKRKMLTTSELYKAFCDEMNIETAKRYLKWEQLAQHRKQMMKKNRRWKRI
jgi:hypothetical protein